METRNKTINNSTYTFVNECKGTRNGFKHTTTLLQNGVEVAENTCYYYNRTWECYEFETSMKGAVYTLIDSKLNRHLARYKEQNDILRFRRGEKERAIADFKDSDIYRELTQLKEAVVNRQFD